MPTYNPADSLNQAGQQQPATDTSLNRLLEEANIAEHLDEDKLEEISDIVYNGYKLDLDSKQEWDKLVDVWVKLAAQIKEEKSWPWPKAANVKYPLLSTAAMQFAARAYPALVPADGKVVQMKVIGVDQQGQKAAKAERLAQHMNYQILKDMSGWEEDMDKLLIQLPIVGCLFKKTYWDSIRKKNCSKLLGPKDLVVNYWASGLESAYRKTEIIPMTKNQIKSMQNAGLYCECELPEPKSNPALPSKADVHKAVSPSRTDETTPYVILEQHTYWDMDEDGYAEPYIITIEEDSKQVLRIVARFDSDGIVTTADGKLVCIEPVEYYTKYDFIPNPDGGFYSVGFGHLLGPLNESANTIINQLIDAGTLANLQSGFIGKGLKLKMGDNRFQPGEWKSVPATGDDIKKQIFPIPVKEPSEVLFKLLGLVIESSEKLASVAEIFVGKMPGQNTPATTTMATIEQGMKVFTAIYKRVYRSLSKEFEKLFRLNSIYAENIEKALHILDAPITIQDYDMKSYDVCPTADPTAVSSTQKLLKVEGLMQLMQLGTLNVMEVTKRSLEAQEQPNIEVLMQQPAPPPDPKVAQMQAKMQMDKESHQMDMAGEQMKLQFKQQEEMMQQKFDAASAQMKLQFEDMKFKMDAEHQVRQDNLDAMTLAREMAMGNVEHRQQLTQGATQHQQKLQQNEAQHQQKMKQLKEQQNIKSKNGNGSKS